MVDKVPPDVKRARRLRREMSYPEVLLWQRLRGSPGGVRFRRQHPVGPHYTIDFYCASAKLAIEVDGEIHAQRVAGDAARDRYLTDHGLRVVHVGARDILSDADVAADAIFRLAQAPLHHASHGPPPRPGEDRRK